MKNKLRFITGIILISSMLACKKENKQPVTTVTNPTHPLTMSELIAGKWYVVKDSTQTLDARQVIPNVVSPQTFGNADFITFNQDSTASVSSNITFNTFYPNYISSNVTSTLSVSPVVNPNLNFKYKVETISGNTPAQPLFDISLQNSNTTIATGFQLTMLSAASIVLYHQEILPTVNHVYTVNQYIYLKR